MEIFLCLYVTMINYTYCTYCNNDKNKKTICLIFEEIKKQVENQCFASALVLLPHSPSSDSSLLAHELRESPALPPLSFPLLPTTLLIAMGDDTFFLTILTFHSFTRNFRSSPIIFHHKNDTYIYIGMSNLYIIFIYFTISKYKIHSFSNIPKYILRMSYYRLELYAKGEKKLPGSWIEAIASYCFHYVSTISRYPHSFHTTSLLTPISAAEYNFVCCNVRSYHGLLILHLSFALVLTLLHLLVSSSSDYHPSFPSLLSFSVSLFLPFFP